MHESTTPDRVSSSPATSADGGQPPAPVTRNTGADCTAPVLASVDWLSATFPADLPLDRVLALFGQTGWEELPRGRYGYKAGKVKGAVRVYSDGTPKMGTHVELSGEGCRQLESAGIVDDWRAFLRQVDRLKGRPSRLDLAFDDHAGILDLDRMEDALSAGEVVTHFQCFEPRERKRIGGNGEGQGRTLYIGSPASDSCLRVYDKRAEQLLKGNSQADDAPWIRAEWQLRNQHAQSMMAALIAGGMERAARLLAGAIEFKKPSPKDSNDRRWQRAEWWARFLGTIEKSTLALFRGAPSFKRTVGWLTHQTASSLGMVMTAAGGDTEWLQRLLWFGAGRMGPRHRAILASVDKVDVWDALDQFLGPTSRLFAPVLAGGTA